MPYQAHPSKGRATVHYVHVHVIVLHDSVNLLFELRVLGSHVSTEGAQVSLADPPNGIDVSAGAVVLGEVSSQTFVDIG